MALTDKIQFDKQLKFLRDQLKVVRQDANQLFSKIITRKQISMFLYPKAKLNIAWSLSDLYERTITAQSLGWEVKIHADEDGLHTTYIEKLPTHRPDSF
jgi:hypothetical protein